jgi:DNA polymerase III subunit delta
MKLENILIDLKKRKFKPVYWLEGDEEFFIDEIINYAEHNILTEGEAGFNKTVFYGRDSDWASVINSCRRYPMFSDMQVVIIKEAQAMRDIDKLENYITKPLESTLLFIAYKGKKVDGRTKLAKVLKDKCVFLSTKKLYENELPEWTSQLIKFKGYTITNKALYLLIDHIGNDLSRINNEIDKLILNIGNSNNITEDDIEKYVGISKEYNVFELQDALAKKDAFKALKIAQYFESNPKAAPLQLIFPSLYSFFSKMQMLYTTPPTGDKALASLIGVPDWKLKDYKQASVKYSVQTVEKNILLLNHYNLKSVGVDDAGTSDGQLLKEMLVKMLYD